MRPTLPSAIDQITPIAELEEGVEARVSGVVRAGPRTLRSDLLDQECVYWDVRTGLGVDAERREVTPFWIEDDSGRVLVTGEALAVDARARRARDVLQTVTRDTHAVNDQLRELKQRLKTAAGEEARVLSARRERLARVVTFLFTVRAHANGKIHLSGKSPEQQQRWIEQNAPEGGEAAATVEVAVTRYEVALAEGDTVIAEGVARDAPIPPGMGQGGGYRDRPTCLALGPGADGAVHVTGAGARQPRTRTERRAIERADHPHPAPIAPRANDPVFERAVVAVVGAVGFVTAIVWLVLNG